MKCNNGHTYQEMLDERQRNYPGTAQIISIYPVECPICKAPVILESTDFQSINDTEKPLKDFVDKAYRVIPKKLNNPELKTYLPDYQRGFKMGISLTLSELEALATEEQ